MEEIEAARQQELEFLNVVSKVSSELHNTVGVAKKSYCNSEIYTTYLNDNDRFWEFIYANKRDNGENKGTDRILTLFLIKYYKDR